MDLLLCMLFIKTSKCFTVHRSFTLPAGAGAVIPVSEGSDGGHRWPVGVAAHHKSTEPLRTTLQILSSLMGYLGGESPGWWGLRYLWGARNMLHMPRLLLQSLPQGPTRGRREIYVSSHPDCQGCVLCSSSPCTVCTVCRASQWLDLVESDSSCSSIREYQMMEGWENTES